MALTLCLLTSPLPIGLVQNKNKPWAALPHSPQNPRPTCLMLTFISAPLFACLVLHLLLHFPLAGLSPSLLGLHKTSGLALIPFSWTRSALSFSSCHLPHHIRPWPSHFQTYASPQVGETQLPKRGLVHGTPGRPRWL